MNMIQSKEDRESTSDGGHDEVLDAWQSPQPEFSGKGGKQLTEAKPMQDLNFDDVKDRLDEAQTHLDEGDRDAALEVYESLAADLQDAGQHGEFLEVAGRMLELEPEHEDIRYAATDLLLADIDIYLRYQLFDQARSALVRALQYVPESAEMQTRLVDVANQLEDQQLFVDSIRELALLKGAGDDVLADYLGRASDWMEPAERIDELADVFDVEPRKFPQGPPPLPVDKENSELGDETTAPRRKSGFGRESSQDTREHGRAFGGNHTHSNLLELLSLVEKCTEPSEICLERADGSAEPDGPMFARIPVANARVELGVEIDGELYVDKALTRVEPELVEKLQRACDPDSEQSLDPRDLSTGERSHLYRMTARALVKVVEEASSAPFWITARRRSKHSEHDISFSPFSLTLSSTSYLLRDGSVVTTRLFDQLSDEVEEAWLFSRPESTKYPCLPFRCTRTNPFRISELKRLGGYVSEMARYHDRLGEKLNTERPIATNISFEDGVWCFVVTSTQVVMLRTERIRMGRVLQTANTLIEKHAAKAEEAKD
ncbi:MAG: hypothetical protein ACQEVA_16105 [Myxococcota bacterium]